MVVEVAALVKAIIIIPTCEKLEQGQYVMSCVLMKCFYKRKYKMIFS